MSLAVRRETFPIPSKECFQHLSTLLGICMVKIEITEQPEHTLVDDNGDEVTIPNMGVVRAECLVHKVCVHLPVSMAMLDDKLMVESMVRHYLGIQGCTC